MTLDDAVGHGQPQPGPPLALRREEGLQAPAADLRRHSGAAILDRHEHRVPRPVGPRRDPQRASLRHGVHRVEDQVHQDVSELGDISLDAGHLVEVRLHVDSGAAGPGLRLPPWLGERDRRPDHLVEVDGPEHLRFVARPGELGEATHEVGGVARRGANQLQAPRHVLLVVQILRPQEQDVGEAAHHRQGVVEIVGDAAGHLAERPQALLLHDLLLAQLELDQLPLEAQDPLRDPEPGAELVRVKGLVGEVVGARAHRLEVVLLPTERGEQDDVGVPRAVLGADAAGELDAVEVRHHPVGDDERHVLALEDRPGLLPVRRGQDLVAELGHDLGKDHAGRRVVFCDQDPHRLSLGSARAAPAVKSDAISMQCGCHARHALGWRPAPREPTPGSTGAHARAPRGADSRRAGRQDVADPVVGSGQPAASAAPPMSGGRPAEAPGAPPASCWAEGSGERSDQQLTYFGLTSGETQPSAAQALRGRRGVVSPLRGRPECRSARPTRSTSRRTPPRPAGRAGTSPAPAPPR